MDQHDTPVSSAPDTADDLDPGTLAEPVAIRARHDGWTPQRQHDFIAALAASGCVTEACQAVGMPAKGANRLRARRPA